MRSGGDIGPPTAAQKNQTFRSRVLIASVLSAAICGAIIMWASPAPLYYEPAWEGVAYYRMAAGQSSTVHFYYSGRFLHPLVVRAISGIFHVSVTRAFYLVSCGALAAFFLALSLYLSLRAPSLLMAIPLLVAPCLVAAFRNYYYQDLFYAALTAMFFLGIAVSPYVGLCFLVLLELTRESTLLLIFTTVGVALYRREKRLATAAVVVSCIGLALVRAHARLAFTNEHNLPPLMFYGLKAAYDFAQNVLGLVFWTNTTAASLHCSLRWQMHIPDWMHLGLVHEVGLCRGGALFPLNTATTLMTTFGALPIVAYVLWRRTKPARFGALEFDAALALVYGLCALIVSPIIGTWWFWETRYVFYAWPLFWLVLPLTAERIWQAADPSLKIALAALIFASTWAPPLFRLLLPLRTGLLAALGFEAVAWIASYRLCRQLKGKSAWT